MTQQDCAPLTGYRVAVTAAGRADELCTLLRRYGATVHAAPAIALVNMSDDGELRRQTEILLIHPPDILIATTATGLRGWLAAADRWGLRNTLLAALSEAQIISRGPKVTGALRAVGLFEDWSSASGSSREILSYLGRLGLDGCRVAVQLHGTTDSWDPVPELLGELYGAGAEVIPIRAYRWQTAAPGGDFDQLLAQIAQRQFDAVSFTSAPAVVATLLRAIKLDIAEELLAALRSGVLTMCIGPVTAEPLSRLGIPTSWPPRMRLAALARHIAGELPLRAGDIVHAGGHQIEIRGNRVLVDGEVRSLSPAGMATLQRLAQRPGAVVTRDDLLRALPGTSASAHAVDTAVLRLRTALGDSGIVATVVKRGYRLAIDERSGAA